MRSWQCSATGSPGAPAVLGLVLGLSLLLLPYRPAAAAGSLGLHLGYAKARDAENGNGLLGGHVEWRPLPVLGIQGAVDYRHVESYELEFPGDSGDLDVRSVPVTVSGEFYLPGAGLSPYALAGAGWYYLVYDYSEALEDLGLKDDSEHSFGWHVGAGLDMRVSAFVSLFGEVRGVFVDPDRDLGQDVVDQITDLDYDSYYLAGGFSLAF